MPRKSKLQQDVEAAIAAFPFAAYRDGSDPAAFANLPEKVQAGIAKCIASDLAAGGTGKDLRAKYSDSDRTNVGLTGPRRREVLRAFGYGGAVRRSYEAYSDAEPRKGSAHASMHGPNAAERQAAALAAVQAAEKAEAAKAARRAKAAERRAAKAAAKAEAAQDAQQQPAEAAPDA